MCRSHGPGKFPAARGHRRAGTQMTEDAAQRGSGLQHVVHRAEQGSVRGAVDRRLLGRGGDEPDVVPAVRGDPVGGDLEHLLGGVDAHYRPGGPDLVVQQRQAQPGTAADVQDGVPGSGRQPFDQSFTPRLEGLGPPVVVSGLAAVCLGRCGLDLRAVEGR